MINIIIIYEIHSIAHTNNVDLTVETIFHKSFKLVNSIRFDFPTCARRYGNQKDMPNSLVSNKPIFSTLFFIQIS